MQWNLKIINRNLIYLLVLCYFIPHQVLAQNDDFFSTLDLQKIYEKQTPQTEEKKYLHGYIQQKLSYAVKDQISTFAFSRKSTHLVQSRTTLNLSTQGSLLDSAEYYISATGFWDAYYNYSLKDEASSQEQRYLGDELEWREVYINMELNENLWIKTGRQIIAWGQSDYSQVLDLANPRDNRELGLMDQEDLRLPVLATKGSVVGKRWGMDLVLTHEFRSDKRPGAGADFDNFIALRNSYRFISADEPKVNINHPELLWRSFFSFPKGDISVIYARVYDDTPTLAFAESDTLIKPRHPRIEAAGITANWINGYWLYKAELAYKRNKLFLNKDWEKETSRLKPLSQFLIGVEYSGITDTQITFECLGESIGNYDAQLQASKTQFSFILAATKNLWHETVSLTTSWGHYVQGHSDIISAEFSYDISDKTKLTIGYVDYMAEDSQSDLYPYRNNDRFFTALRYSF